MRTGDAGPARSGRFGMRIARLRSALAHSGRHAVWAHGHVRQVRNEHMSTRLETKRLIEEGAKRLGMSTEQFYGALDSGQLPDTPAAAHLRLLVGTRRR